VGARRTRGATHGGGPPGGPRGPTGRAARHPAVPRDRIARGVPDVAPRTTQAGVDVQVGPRARGGADRARTGDGVHRATCADGGSLARRAVVRSGSRLAAHGGRWRRAPTARAGRADRRVVRGGRCPTRAGA
jgi:hypothetical protein